MEKLKNELMRIFDEKVQSLSQEDYKELLESMLSDLESRLDCVNEELGEDL